MIIFLYGDDSFRSHEKLMEIQNRYKEKAGDLNLTILEDEKLTAEELARQTNVLPFLASSRLIIAKNACQTSAENQQKIIRLLFPKLPKHPNLPNSTNLVFHENKAPDKRGALYKKLFASADKKQEFKILVNWEILKFIREKVARENGKITPAAVEKLALFCTSDTGRINQEIKKLLAYQPTITEENIELLVSANISADIFNLVDAIGTRNLNQAQKILADLFASGQNELYILSMLIYGWRNLLLVKLAKNPWQIKLHPFVRQKTIAMANHFSEKELKIGYAKILETDIAMKTGGMENKLALQILLTKLAR